ncbi:MAG: outer membrane protein assembly factor BamD [Burkholderiales bacterium]|nr:outer membrane protein assembly factor BamD [Burkholderiales bacterium]
MRHALALALLLWLGGCSLLPDLQDETRGWSAQKLYTEAKAALSEGDYDKAIKYYETLEARFPYGRYAQQAQLEIAYAYYKSRETASALAAADRFIKLHPNHPHVDYAYYLKGLINFNDDLGFLGYLVTQDLSDRDPQAARDAFEAFKELVTRFPESRYTPDALARMNYLLDALAKHEAAVAHYYFRRGAYVAAVNRAQNLLKQYPQAPANEDALAILWASYDKLGLTELRDDARRILERNFPQSAYLRGKQPGNPRPWYQFW